MTKASTKSTKTITLGPITLNATEYRKLEARAHSAELPLTAYIIAAACDPSAFATERVYRSQHRKRTAKARVRS